MKKDLPPEIKENIISFLDGVYRKFEDISGMQSYEEMLNLWQAFHQLYIDASDSALQKWAEKFNPGGEGVPYDIIKAQSVVVEISDRNTGKLFRRDLPVKYHENDNGIVLTGEATDGSQAEITFLSETAVQKIIGLTGKGPDQPHCND